jgi:hypothetical protein
MNRGSVPRGLRRWCLPAAVVTFALAGAGPAMAAEPSPIGPNQFFTGFVNGLTDEARVAVVCDGPRGEDGVPTGHPAAGQTVEVRPLVTANPGPPLSNFGFTGSAGKAVGVQFSGSDPAGPAVLMRHYNEPAEIPTNILVPCDARGAATFVPVPTSRSAASATVRLFYVSSKG